MRALLVLFLFFSCSAFSEETPPAQPSIPKYTESDISLTAEGLPSTFVNHVNTVFGNFLLPTVDFIVPGPTPLPMIRYYNSESTIGTWLHGIGMSSNYPLWIRGAYPSEGVFHATLPKLFSCDTEDTARYPHSEDDEDDCNLPYEQEKGSSQDEKKFAYAYAEEDGGSILYFSAKPERKEMEFYLDPKTIHKGLTNVGLGEISARTNMKNARFYSKMKRKDGYMWDPEGYETEWVVALSNGGERHYGKDRNFTKEKILEEEVKPSGNKLFFTCGSSQKWGVPLQKIIATNNTGKHHFGWLEVKYPQKFKKILVHSSNGKYAAYFFERHSTKKLHDAPYITKVYSSDQPATRYEYTACDGKRLMSKIIYPQGRYLHLKYDSDGRVEEERGPVGHNNKEASIYRFKYHPHDHHTTVYDANDNKTLYHYSSKKRLKSIERLDAREKLIREDRFFWGDREEIRKGERDSSDEGNLLGHTIEGPEGALSCTRYNYDDFGNITEEKLYGNLTGTSKDYFSVDGDGIPKKEFEKYRKYAKYNNDRFHLCTERTEDDGPTFTFHYKENTDLLTAKLTQESSHIKIREFFEYDQDAVLVKKIVDDGSDTNPESLKNVTERHVTHIKPIRNKEDYGIGQPEEIQECYLDLSSGKEVLFRRTLYEYYKDGKVSKERVFDAHNNQRYSISYSYDRLGNITRKTHSAGKELLYSYDENGNKISEELVGSKSREEFHYDFANRLIRKVAIHADGPKFTTTYTYDKASNRTSMTDKFGQVTNYEYDALSRLTKINYPSMLDKNGKTISPSEEIEYDVLNKPQSVTDPNGHATNYKHTTRGQPCLISYPDGSTERFIYNKNGTLAKKVDRHGVEIAYEYDVLHRVTKTILGGSKVTTHTYSAFHETSQTDPMGNTFYYRYDGAGRLCKKNDGGQKTIYSYDELGRKTSTKEYLKDDSFIETIHHFDLFDRLIEEKTQHSDGTLLSLKKYAYDVLNNCTEVTTYSASDVFHTEYTTYNSQSLPTSSTDALGHVTRYEYDYKWKNELGQFVFKKTTIDPLSNQTIEVSDAYHRIDTVEKRSSKNELLAKTTFRYDAKGNKTQEKELVYADGVLLREYVIEWTYTPSDLIETCTEQPGTFEKKKTGYNYVRGGLLETITKPDGVLVTHAYDEFSRLSSIKTSDHTVHYTYSYDLNDNVLSVQDSILNLTNTKTYDKHNRVRKDSLGTGVEATFTYDALDRVTGLSTCGHQVDYLYQSGRLKDVVCKDTFGNERYAHRYESFDLCGHVTRSSLISSCGTLQQDFDALGRLERISSQHFEENCSKFDDAGNLLEITQTDPQGKITSTFTYDDLYQLIEEKGVLDASYKNDSLHNRLKKNDDPYSINTLNQLLSEGGTSYTYDRNGNPISIGPMRLSYDGLDRLVLLERPGYSRSKYAYDASHRRISKTTFLLKDGSWQEEEYLRFLFFNKREIGSLDSQGNVKDFRVLGLGKGAELGASIALELDGKVLCPLHDHRGNISVLIDTITRQPSDTYRYSAFGEETSFGSTKNPWRFASKRVDPESGFVFFGRRYFSPTVGRFLTPDPIGFADGPNLYAYVHNSPMILVDSYGLSTTTLNGPTSGDTSTYSWSPGSNGPDNSFWHPSDNTSSYVEGPSGDVGIPGIPYQNSSGMTAGENSALNFWNEFSEGYFSPLHPAYRTVFPNEEWNKKSQTQKASQYAGSVAYGIVRYTPLGRMIVGVASVLGRCPYIGRGLSCAVRNISTVYHYAKQAYQPWCGAKSSKNSSDTQRNKEGGVYVLRDKETGEVMRTGRTNDFGRRELEHKRDPILGKYDFKSLHPTNSYPEQRGLEQKIHMRHEAPLDKISSISPNNPRRDEYMKAAEEFLWRNNEN